MIFVILSSKRQIKNILWTNTTQVSLFFLSFTGNQAGFSDPQRSTCFELSAVCINTAWIPNLPKVGSVGSEQFGGDFSKQNIKYQNFFCFISLQQYRQLPAPNASASYFCSSVYWDMEIILQGFGVWCMWLSHLAGLLLGLSRFILGGTTAKKSVFTYKMPPNNSNHRFLCLRRVEPQMIIVGYFLFQRGVVCVWEETAS